jgi:hypothetical protein
LDLFYLLKEIFYRFSNFIIYFVPPLFIKVQFIIKKESELKTDIEVPAIVILLENSVFLMI